MNEGICLFLATAKSHRPPVAMPPFRQARVESAMKTVKTLSYRGPAANLTTSAATPRPLPWSAGLSTQK